MLTEERERTGISSLKVSYNKIFGYFLEVNNVHIKSVPENYIRKQTLVNAERYITPQLKEFEEEIITSEERIRELEYDLFQSIKKDVNQNTKVVQKTAEYIAEIDALAGLAYVAEKNQYARPILRPLNANRKLILILLLVYTWCAFMYGFITGYYEEINSVDEKTETKD